MGVVRWDSGLLARMQYADDVCVLARVLDASDDGAAVVGLLLHVALGVAVSHGPAEQAPLGPASTAAALPFLR